MKVFYYSVNKDRKCLKYVYFMILYYSYYSYKIVGEIYIYIYNYYE